MDISRIAAVCIAMVLAASARGEPGTPSWVRADTNNGSPSALPAIELTFKGWKERARFFVAVTRNGEPVQITREQMGFSGRCANNFPLAYHGRYTCLLPASPTKSAAQDWHEKPGTEGYAMYFRKLEWSSEYCFRLRAQDDKGEYAKLWTGWACARTNAAPPPLSPPYGVTLTGVPATTGNVDSDATPDRLWVTYVLATGSVESWLEKSPTLNNASWTRVPKSDPGKRGIVIQYGLDQKVAYFRVCASNVVQQACSAPHRFPPRGLEENAKIDSAPRYEQQRPPVTSANARSGSTVTSAPPPVTATNAAKAPSTSAFGTAKGSSTSSFERAPGFGR